MSTDRKTDGTENTGVTNASQGELGSAELDMVSGGAGQDTSSDMTPSNPSAPSGSEETKKKSDDIPPLRLEIRF